jgi:hypothetical protein
MQHGPNKLAKAEPIERKLKGGEKGNKKLLISHNELCP